MFRPILGLRFPTNLPIDGLGFRYTPPFESVKTLELSDVEVGLQGKSSKDDAHR